MALDDDIRLRISQVNDSADNCLCSVEIYVCWHFVILPQAVSAIVYSFETIAIFRIVLSLSETRAYCGDIRVFVTTVIAFLQKLIRRDRLT